MQAFALVARGRLVDLYLPEAVELGGIDRLPVALLKLVGGEMAMFQGPDQFEAGNPGSVISEQAARRDKQPDPA